MNWPQLRYRIKVGGLPWLAKTALGVIGSRLRPPARESTPLEATVGAHSPGSPEILYVHSGWAIETVGRLWFTNQTRVRVTFIRASDPSLTKELMDRYDFVWYGYSSLFSTHPCDPRKAILAVHDPAELFPEGAGWKTSGEIKEASVRQLRSARATVVISQEMQEVLASHGVKALRIPTRSQIPLRSADELEPISPALLAVGRIYRRKNFEQFKRIARLARPLGYRSYLKGDHFPLSDSDYLALLDRFPIYVCTSHQEGGPLPLMDAMNRGAVAISAPVGQVPEIIQHGLTGFICQTDEEFRRVLEELASDPDRVLRLRRASLARIQEVRPPGIIDASVDGVFDELLPNSPRN